MIGSDENQEGRGVADAKERLIEWGTEAEAAHRDFMKQVRRWVPWAVGGVGTLLAAALFGRAAKRTRVSTPRPEKRRGWLLALPVALKYGPSLIGLLLKSWRARRRRQQTRNDVVTSVPV